MAKKQDNKAARERKQKIFLAVAGVVFLALIVIQGPKLLKQVRGSESAAPAASSNTADPTSAPSGASTAAPASPAASAPAPAPAPVAHVPAPKSARTQLAGVVIVPEQPVKAGDGQLSSFSRFQSKDPFVQQVGEQPLPTPQEIAGMGGATPKAPDAAQPQPTSPATPSLPDTGKGGTAVKVVQTPTLAVLLVNGKLHSLEAGKRFPKGDPAFLLKTLKPGRVGIAVANGSFAGGGVLTLRVGRKVTLVNTATGGRYVVKLVYLGTESNLTRFSSK
jgi:hypothetical protein